MFKRTKPCIVRVRLYMQLKGGKFGDPVFTLFLLILLSSLHPRKSDVGLISFIITLSTIIVSISTVQILSGVRCKPC